MTKEYKQIEVTVGEKKTTDFKRAIAYAKAQGITTLVFSWSPKARTSSDAFATRISNVLSTLTDWEFEAKLTDTNQLTVTRKGTND